MEKEKILIVEDEIITSRYIQNLLRDQYDVNYSTSGEKALRLAEENSPDLVLMDVKLKGGLDGIETAEKIQDRQDTPVIFMSGFDDQYVVDKAKFTTPYGFVAKPISERELLINIEFALTKFQQDKMISRLNSILNVVRTVNQKIVKEKNPQRLIEDVCQLFTQRKEYTSAWILLTDMNNKVNGFAGSNIADENMGQFVEQFNNGDHSNCIKKVLKGDDISIINMSEDFCGDCPLYNAYETNTAITKKLVYNGKLLGFIGVGIPHNTEIDNEEIELFKEISDDITFALNNLELERIQQENERKINEQQQTIQSIYRSAPVGIGMAQNRIIQFVNEEFCDMLGYNSKELIGKNSKMLYADHGEYKKVGEIYRDVLKSGIARVETQLKKKNGEVIDVLLSLSSVENESYFNGITFTVLDITEKNKFEKDLKNSQKELQLRNEISNKFLMLSDEQIFADVLDLILDRFDSEYGFIGYIGSEGELVCPSMTEGVMEICEVKGKDNVFPQESWGGIWGESLKTHKSLIKNKNLDLPEGHIHLFNAMAVPIIHNDELIGQITIASKKEGFTQKDKASLEDICNYIAPILNSRIQRKKAEEQLKESEKKYRDLYTSIRDAILVADTDRNIIDCNPAFTELFGYEFSEVQGSPTSKVYANEEEFQKLGKEIKNNLKQSNFVSIVNYKRKNGEVFPGETKVFYLKTSDDEVVGFIGLIRDVSERIESEQRIKESEEKYRISFEEHSVVRTLVDLETRQIVDANKAASDFYGWSNEQLKQMKIDDFDILSAEEIENKVNKVRNSEKLEFHLQHKLSDGSIRDVNVFNSIIEIKGKKYIDAIIYDITDRKKAERELENYKNHLEELVKERTNELETQYEFLRTLIDNIPNPVFIKDKDFKYTDMNSAFERFFGNSRHGLIGKTHYDLLPKKLADYLTEKDEKLLKEPGHQFYEVALQNAKGILTPVIFYKSTFTDTNGNILGIIGLFVDISNRKKMEEQINEALEKERELNEIKNNFLSLVSHEFRTPLTSILSSADLLELYGRTWEKDKYYKYVEQIQRAVDEMSKMLDDVSTLNKADRGKILFNPADIDLYHFACDLIEQIRTFTQSNQEAVFDYRADDTIYHLDEKLLRQILMNLLTNAIKYSPDGGKIYLNVKSDKKFLIFKVKDQGMGISNSDQEKLFDPFFRSSEIQNISGSGLGLSIVQKALELHGGTIKIESELGKGSTFTVKIPIISK